MILVGANSALGMLRTDCDDGTKAVSQLNTVPGRWETTISESPWKACTARVHPLTKAVELRCR
jgi:hypothetical protein